MNEHLKRVSPGKMSSVAGPALGRGRAQSVDGEITSRLRCPDLDQARWQTIALGGCLSCPDSSDLLRSRGCGLGRPERVSRLGARKFQLIRTLAHEYWLSSPLIWLAGGASHWTGERACENDHAR